MFHRLSRIFIALVLVIGAGVSVKGQSVTLRMDVRPMEVIDQIRAEEAYYDFYYNYYLPLMYLREGFVIEPGDWWIGNQPYLPYYGYNPPTTNGYYPPYAYPSSNYYGGYGVPRSIQPAPPLVTPPVQVPTLLARPVAPPPLRYRITSRGIVVERDPQFQLFVVPQYPSFLTGGSVIYQTPPYRDYNPFPYSYPYYNQYSYHYPYPFPRHGW